MATHDYVIANASGAAVRSDLNNALAAIVSNNSNTTEPATTYAYQSWADTTAGLMKIRNSTNDDWVSLYNLDGSSLGPGKVTFGATEVVFNDAGNNVDFRIEGDTDANLFFVDASADKVGIGTTSPSSILDIVTSAGNLEVDALGSTSTKIRHTTTGGILALEGDSGIRFDIDGDNEKARLDSSGRLLVGTSSSSADTRAIIQGRSSAGDSTGRLYISSGNNSPGDGDGIAELYFSPSNHTATARIAVQRDGGTWTAGSSQPSRLVFSTCASGASSPTERMRITSGGDVIIGKTSTVNTTNGIFITGVETGNTTAVLSITNTEATDTSAGLLVNRQGSDGRLVQFRQNNTVEGTISVSGTTVTYGGGHLARWSQLLNKEDPSGILKGTVMSNLDEMCEWGEEDNEQLNKTKVSDVEGDPNVAGVFVSTSFDEKGPEDFFVAMTGDMVIRIAQGVTVERGDLLMSAGDGTAKPQDDDIIRSKTVAKVTSTHVSETYADGSYCVPCVLMAC